MIDNDEGAYSSQVLHAWKRDAEQDAKSKIGRTKTSKPQTREDSVSELRRNHRMRDDLRRDLLKPPLERRLQPIGTSRIRKFAHTEIIIHRLDDKTYPNVDEKEVGISSWFKLEVFDFYFGGLEGIVGIEYALLDNQTHNWALLTYGQSEKSFLDRFRIVKIFVTAKIPFRNIRYYDMRGDEYYPQPHLYCDFADNGTPYEAFGYYIIGGNESYEFVLNLENKKALGELEGS